LYIRGCICIRLLIGECKSSNVTSKYTTNIGIKDEVYEKLEDRKSPGQSFSGVIQELIQKADQNGNDGETA